MGDPLTGKEYIARSIQSDPGNPEAHNVLISQLTREGDLQSTGAAIEFALQQCPDSATILHKAGLHYYTAGDVNKAEKALSKAVELDPHSTTLALSMAEFYFKANSLDKALEAYESVRHLSPLDTSSRIRLSQMYLEKGQLDEAWICLDELVNLESQKGEFNDLMAAYWLKRGNQLFSERKFNEAEAAYSKSLEFHPLFASAVSNRVLALLNLDRARDAADFVGRFLDENPDALFACQLMAEIHFAVGQSGTAAEWLERGLDEAKRHGAEKEVLQFRQLIQRISVTGP